MVTNKMCLLFCFNLKKKRKEESNNNNNNNNNNNKNMSERY